jgi:hypothetical protein
MEGHQQASGCHQQKLGVPDALLQMQQAVRSGEMQHVSSSHALRVWSVCMRVVSMHASAWTGFHGVVSVLCMLVQPLMWFLVPALVASWQVTAYGRKQL